MYYTEILYIVAYIYGLFWDFTRGADIPKEVRIVAWSRSGLNEVTAKDRDFLNSYISVIYK